MIAALLLDTAGIVAGAAIAVGTTVAGAVVVLLAAWLLRSQAD